MESKYEVHYHVNEDGSANVLCELLKGATAYSSLFIFAW